MNIRDEIQQYLDATEIKLAQNYEKLGLKNTGSWSRSLDNNIEVTDTGFKATITGANYTYWLENGRNAGAVPTSIIRKWIDTKGIVADGISKDSLAFIIARKIRLEGIKVPNRFNAGGLVSDVITNEHINTLLSKVKDLFLINIKSDVIKSWQ